MFGKVKNAIYFWWGSMHFTFKTHILSKHSWLLFFFTVYFFKWRVRVNFNSLALFTWTIFFQNSAVNYKFTRTVHFFKWTVFFSKNQCSELIFTHTVHVDVNNNFFWITSLKWIKFTRTVMWTIFFFPKN